MSTKREKKLRLDDLTRGLIARLWRDWLVRYWPTLLLALALMAVVAGATGLYPVLIERAFRWFEAKNHAAIYLLPGLVLAVTAVKGGALYAQTVLTSRVVLSVVRDLQARLFAHLLAADLGQLAQTTTGSLVSRFVTDMAILRDALTRAINNLVRDTLTLIALLGSMLYLDWLLTVVVLALYPLAAWPITAISKRLRRQSATTQAHAGDMTALVSESLAGARMVKSYGLEAYEEARATRAFTRLYELMQGMVRNRTRLEPLLEVLGGLAVAGVLVFAGSRIASGQGSVGSFTGFVTALLLATQPVRAIGTLAGVVQEGLAAVERTFRLLDEKPAITDSTDAKPLAVPRGQIVFRDVVFRYGEALTLDHVSLDIPAGTTVALVGPSGAGKTTVMNLIPRLFDVEAGTIAIDGTDIRSVTLKSLRSHIALVSQDVILFNDTVRANIAFGRPGADAAAIERAARAASAHDFIEALPQGYETIVGEDGAKLSGGQRQRIAIARAMVKDAPILLLDEATSALDSEAERQVQQALAVLKRGRTTLVIAHRLSTVLDADRIYVLDQGRVVERGSHAELLRQGGLYAKLYATQFAGEARAAPPPSAPRPERR